MNLWGRLKANTCVVKRWQLDHFSIRERRIIECEEALEAVLSNPVACGQSERDYFQEEKSKLMIELNQLRITEKICGNKIRGFSNSEKEIATQPISIR